MARNFDSMKVSELKAYALENNIAIPYGAKKSDILAIIAAEKGEETIPEKKSESTITKILRTKPGLTLINSESDFIRSFIRSKYQLVVYTICPHCGEKVYAYCYTETDEEPADTLFSIKKHFEKCPKCGNKLGLIQGRYFQEYIGRSETIKNCASVFKKLEKSYEEIDRDTLREKASQYVDSIQNNNPKPNNLDRKFSFEELKQYILYLIHLESEIYYLNERLVEVQMKEQINNQGYTRAKIVVNEEVDKEFSLINKGIADEIRKLKRIVKDPQKGVDKKDLIVEIDLETPVEPGKPRTKKPEEPQAPIYKKPGIFNKKRIMVENEELRQEYEKEKKKYETELLEYDNEQKAYLSQLEQFKKNSKRYKSEYQKAYDLALNKEIERIITENNALLSEKNKIAKKLSAKKKERIDEYLEMSPQKKIESILSFEEKGIRQELKTVVSARDQLYSYDIIYGKYRNYVALTSLYEYLDSGRCRSLEGPEGAYNLFEMESRSNEIIVQLKTIVDSLEMIKTNQFMLYKEMKEVNKNLIMANSSLEKAIDEIASVNLTAKQVSEQLGDIGGTTKEILSTSKQTAYNTAVTAHYAEITAHYSKVNAELTDALGFMIAMK